MKTELITRDITPAVKLLQAGGLVAVPTETVYGLAGNGLDPGVIEKIYEVKGRPPVKPISLMVSDAGAIDRLCEAVPPAAFMISVSEPPLRKPVPAAVSWLPLSASE